MRKRHRISFFFTIFLSCLTASCAVDLPGNQDDPKQNPPQDNPKQEDPPSNPNTDPNTDELTKLGDFIPSFYWIALEKNTQEPRDQKVLDNSGKVLAMVGKNFLKELKMEGTGRLLDGRLLNFSSFFDIGGAREIRYRIVQPGYPYGYGIDNRKLQAFRTVAVDPRVIRLDTLLYIPEAKGVVLPDGAIHDGYFHALDGGTAINNDRIDVFTSFGNQSSVFAPNLTHGKKIQVFLYESK